MADLFHLQLLLAFLVGSSWITMATVAADKFGSKIGGFIGGFPSMVAITLFFIGLVQTPGVASEATTVIPLIMGINGLFLVMYVTLARWGAWVGFSGALLTWVVLASLVVLLDLQNFTFSLGVCILLLCGSYILLEKKLKIGSVGRTNFRTTPLQILFRALFSGSIVTSGVYLAKMGGPIWGGIFAPFPTVYLSTLIITMRSRGVEFSRMMTKPLLISATVNVMMYSIAVRYFYPVFGLTRGTLLSLAVAAVSACSSYFFIKTRMR